MPDLKTTKAIECTCRHDFQDEKYGYKYRLHVRGKSAWRCTVCGNEISAVKIESKK